METIDRPSGFTLSTGWRSGNPPIRTLALPPPFSRQDPSLQTFFRQVHSVPVIVVPFAKVTFILAIAVVTGLTAFWLIWHLSYSVQSMPPAATTTSDLGSSVSIEWGVEHDARISAQTRPDAVTALGYVHAWRYSWTMALWRQAALGQLSAWFGPAAMSVDRLITRLGISARARESLETLTSSDRAQLRAYASGVNTAFQHPDLALGEEFVLVGQGLADWQPWHTLAVERLMAWLATTPPSPDTLALASSEIANFYEADNMLRQWLHLHGFDNSLAASIVDSSGRMFFQRHVYGNTIRPLFQDVTITMPQGAVLQGATLPGTPFFPGGRSNHGAWALFLSSTARLVHTALAVDSVSLTHTRITHPDGSEELLTNASVDGHLLFTPEDPIIADSVWLLQWPGLSAGSDLAAWTALPGGEPASFTLFDGHGLWMNRAHEWTILGAPPVQRMLPSGVVVGMSPWVAHVGSYLTRMPARGLDQWIADAYSVWAEETVPAALRELPVVTPVSGEYRNALSYLNNWDFRFHGASIAGSIFDTWMANYWSETGVMPDAAHFDAAIDSTNRVLLHTALAAAINMLTADFGPDQSQWRWEEVHPEQLQFPIRTVEQSTGQTYRARAHRDPLVWPGHGHPSTVAWNASGLGSALRSSARWEAWVESSASWNITVRRRTIGLRATADRYFNVIHGPVTAALPTPVVSSTTLLPKK